MLILITFFYAISFQNDFVGEVKSAKTIFVPNNYTTIQAAIDNANPGDTIYVWAGTYYENIVVNKTVTLIGNGSEDTIIDGGGVGDVMMITADWVNVRGFKLINSGNGPSLPPYGGIELYDVENVTILNNNCSNNGNGINVKNSKKNNIINNTCYSNNYNGILIYHSDLNKLENNTYKWSILYYGIYLNMANSNNVINNTCIDCSHGIMVRSSELNHLNNNICNSNDDMGIWIYTSNSNTIENSICNSNSLNGIKVESSRSNIIANSTCGSNYYAGILLENSEENIVMNNSCESTWLVGISLKSSMSNTLSNNELISCSLYIDGDYIEHWNSHTIDTSNTVDDNK